MRVLLVEDDSATAASIEMMLRAEGFICDTTDLGEDGLEIGKLYDYDIIILDLMLPDIDGYEVLRRLRAARVRTPILILSGLAELDHKIKGLGFGADDFLTKPFDRRELIARIQAIVRRAKGHSESVIRTGKLHGQSRQPHRRGRWRSRCTSPARNTASSSCSSLRKGTTLTKEMFLNHLYGGMDEPELKIIDVFVCKLRKKLATATDGDNYIETVWGRGYVLRDPPAESASGPSRKLAAKALRRPAAALLRTSERRRRQAPRRGPLFSGPRAFCAMALARDHRAVDAALLGGAAWNLSVMPRSSRRRRDRETRPAAASAADPVEHRGLGRLIEIDQHVAAEDDVEAAELAEVLEQVDGCGSAPSRRIAGSMLPALAFLAGNT